MPKVSRSLSQESRKLTVKDRMLLFGGADGKENEHVKRIPAGGCNGEAESIISGGQAPESAIAAAQRIDVESFTLSLKDPAFVRANKNWSLCMAKKGYKYSSPLKAISDAKFQEASEATEQEKKV